MTMFHLQYPASKTFLTWDELGCLCRALGLPVDLFQRHFPTDVYELKQEEHGISIKTIGRLFELNLLQKALHRTYNFHTADWNVCVITRALYMLDHRVLDYEGLHDVRVAYGTYEHVDMKGLVLHKHILLRTLKMCGRSIAPLKLMHRIKHMKNEFEEKGRIQLYEFFNLIVWCDLYTVYDPQEMETAVGKEEDLFKLVDFERLLNHHDARVAAKLNAQYLAEERDFGMEVLAGKTTFKEPPVYTEARISQAKYHKQNYKALKKEVNHSQKRLYRAYAGSIRSRPISAPDLDAYRHHAAQTRPVESSAQEAYESVRRRLHSAPSRASKSTNRTDHHPYIVVSDFERPVLSQPRVVTQTDLSDARKKMEDLQFNINTLASRCKLQVQNEMEFYIPGYLDKLANRKPEEQPAAEPERKPQHWTKKIINDLAYPASNLKPSHAKNCDARYRGWLRANSKPGWHAVITSHTHENSDKGRQYARMEQRALEPVQYVHQDYVVRFTPPTWPGLLSVKPARRADEGKTSDQKQQQQQTLPNFRFRSLEKQKDDDEAEPTIDREGPGSEKTERKSIPDLSFFHNKYLTNATPTAETESVANQNKANDNSSGVAFPKEQQSFPRGLQPAQRKTLEPARENRPHDSRSVVPLTENKLQVGPSREDIAEWAKEIPMPHMEHSKPKLVGVGQIGTIALLENIEESRDLEENWKELDDNNIQEDLDEGLDEEDLADDKSDILRPLSQPDLRRPKKMKGRPSKSQPSSNQQIREVASALKNRSSHSAPQRRAGTSSSKKTSPKLMSPKRTPPKSPRYRDALNDENTAPVFPTAENDDSPPLAPLGGISPDKTIIQYTSSSESPCSPLNAPRRFTAMRGSVTSEEDVSDKQQVQIPSEKTQQKKISRGAVNEERSQNQACTEDEDKSSYSDVLTIASSDGLSDLPASPPAGIRGLPVFIATDKKADTVATPRSVPDDLSTVANLPRIHFDLVNLNLDLDGKHFKQESGSSSPAERKGIQFRHSSASQRKDSLVIHCDIREYLSDSEPRKSPTFSRESRARLIGRVENAISPDLKHKLMAGDPGLMAQFS